MGTGARQRYSSQRHTVYGITADSPTIMAVLQTCNCGDRAARSKKDGQPPTPRHCVARIKREVQQNLFDLRPVCARDSHEGGLMAACGRSATALFSPSFSPISTNYVHGW
jgi:hypothetical protein